MIYPKNKEKTLSEELFKNPTSEYRGAPFWAWNCELDRDELLWQIEQLKKMGFGGFHMHSRDGMATPYLSEEFMDLVKACCDKAEAEEMRAYLYDEDRWPSGSAGGMITKDRRYSQRQLIVSTTPKASEPDFDKAFKNGLTYKVAEYNVSLNEHGELASYKRTDAPAKGNETKWYAYTSITEATGWYNNQTYINTLSKDAIDKFIQITHEGYKKAVGERFGKSVHSIFTDEPQFSFKETFNFVSSKNADTANKQKSDVPTVFDFSHSYQNVSIPWVMDFDEGYKRFYGYSILDKLPEIFWELPNGKISSARYDYHKYVTELFATSFCDNCGSWCEKNGIALTGHMLMEETLESQTTAVGDAMRSYRCFGIPGMDLLCDTHEYTTAKQVQSAVHQFGREAMTSELYGVTNWDFDFRGHKSQGDWQAALGVTLRVPHLSWVSMKGSAKRDYPASINYQSSWYKEYSYIENHFARVNTALTRGKPIINIAVIHPIETYWLHFGPKESTADIRAILDEHFKSLCDWLISAQLDFNYISEALLPYQKTEISDKLKVGEMEYNVVLIAGCETLRSTTLDVLEKFQSFGGKIIFAGNCPGYCDAVTTDRVAPLYNKAEKVGFEKSEILNALNDERIVEIRNSNGSKCDNLIYQLRQDNDCKWLFIAYKNKETDSSTLGIRRLKKIIIKGEYTPLIYDTLTGEIKNAEFEISNGKTIIHHTFCKQDSLLLKLCAPTITEYKAPVEKKTVISEVYLTDKVSYTLSEPNVVLLDIAEYHGDNEPFEKREEVRKIQDLLKAKYKLVNNYTQAWAIEPETIVHTATLKYRFTSEIEVENTFLATEDAEAAKIIFNGNKIDNTAVGYFTDKSIKTIPLPRLKKGENVIEITYPLGNRTNIENVFVLGDFNVKSEGIEKTIYAKSDYIHFGDIVPQGLPFYGANITYNAEIDAPEDCDAIIVVKNYKGAVIRCAVDGKDLGIIAFSPYELCAKGLKKGKHTISLTLFASRINCFGALHTTDQDSTSSWYWHGPDCWEFMRTDVTSPDFTMDVNGKNRWSYEYNLSKIGILSAPQILFVK